MKPDTLRAEYVLTGGTFLMSLAAVLWAQERRGNGVGLASIAAQLTKDSPFVALGLLIGAAYVFGIVCVQLTFFFPTEGLIEVRRAQRWAELRRADQELCQHWSAQQTEHAALLKLAFHQRSTGEPVGVAPSFFLPYKKKWEAFREGLRRIRRIKRRETPDLTRKGPPTRRPGDSEGLLKVDSLTLSLGRQLATGDVTREYEYRRSNRQVFVGVLPSTLPLLVAGLLWPAFDSLAITIALKLSVVFADGLFIIALISSASYQEKVAQAQLLDTAFVARWKNAEAKSCTDCQSVEGGGSSASGPSLTV